MKISGIIKISKDERGQALIEFALIFTLLVVLLFGIAEFGRGWFYANAMSNGARDGARYASMQPKDNFENNVENYTYRQVAPSVKPASNIYVSVTAISRWTNKPKAFAKLSSGDSVTVAVGYDMVIVTGNIIPSFSGTRKIVRQATMRYEGK